MKRAVIASLLLVIALSSVASADTGTVGVADCAQLDSVAIQFAQRHQLDEAGKAFDRAIAQCPASPERFTSRGVLYAAMGEKVKAAALINDAILLAERTGDECRADISRAELAMLNGGKRLDVLPKSCQDERTK